MEPIGRDRVERVARVYATNAEAAQALGVEPRSFSRMCRRHGIETPYARRRRRHSNTQQTHVHEIAEGV